MSPSIAIKILTTDNRQHLFSQIAPPQALSILANLKKARQVFTEPVLIVVSHNHSEVFNPQHICYIEFETSTPLGDYLPDAWYPHLRILGANEDMLPDSIDDGDMHTRIDFSFVGGHLMHAWLEGEHDTQPADCQAQLTRLLSAPQIPFQPLRPGIGLINPMAVVRARVGLPLDHVACDTWRADEV